MAGDKFKLVLEPIRSDQLCAGCGTPSSLTFRLEGSWSDCDYLAVRQQIVNTLAQDILPVQLKQDVFRKYFSGGLVDTAEYFVWLAEQMVPVMMVIHDHRVIVSLRCAGEVMREQYNRNQALDAIIRGLWVMRWMADGNAGGIFKYPPYYYAVQPEQIQSLL